MITDNENELYINKKYDQLIIIYNNDLNNKNLLNRCLCYLNLKKYNNAFNDALKLVEYNDSYAKVWGYLGASLYGLNKLEDAIKVLQVAQKSLDNDLKSKEESIAKADNGL